MQSQLLDRSSALTRRVLDFWFQGLVENQSVPQSCFKRWFGGSAETDEFLRQSFGADIDRLLADAENALGRQKIMDALERSGTEADVLGTVIMLDQFPRNLYRGSRRAFAGDQAAIQIAIQAIQKGRDRSLPLVQRSFMYLPLMHAENREHQDTCVDQFTLLNRSSAGTIHENLTKSMLDYAIEHRSIVDRFGRFPHRNVLLDRPSTSEETDFLARGGSTFGQSSNQ